jgi:hypothetical protein
LNRNNIENISNAILFYFGWSFTVLNAAAKRPTIALLGAFLLSFLFILLTKNKKKALLLLFSMVITGFFFETLFVNLNILHFPIQNPLSPNFSPFWILGLYALFSTTLNHCLVWLKKKTLLQACMGAFGGFVSYFAGYKLGAVLFPMHMLSAFFVALGWAILLPIFYFYNDLLSNYTEEKNNEC